MKHSKSSKNMDFYFTILDSLRLNYKNSMNDIANKLGTSKQNIYFYTEKLKRLKLLERIGKAWQLTENANKILEHKDSKSILAIILDKSESGKSNDSIRMMIKGVLGESPLIQNIENIDLHALNIKMPILSGKADFTELGGREIKGFKNWSPQYLKKYQPIELSIRNNNNRSISIFIKSKKIKKLNEVYDIVAVAKMFVFNDLSRRFPDLKLDIVNSETQNINLAKHEKQAEERLKKGDVIKQFFDKDRRKILEKDPNQQSYAMVDTSPDPSIETNDLDYIYSLIRMPFNIENTQKNLAELTFWTKELARDMNVHKPVLVKNQQTMEENKEINKDIVVVLREIRDTLPKDKEKESKAALTQLKSLIKEKTDVLRFSDLFRKLTEQDNLDLWEWMCGRFD